jgi:serine acetyltransferase
MNRPAFIDDIRMNKTNIKGLFILLFYRLTNWLHRGFRRFFPVFLFLFPVAVLYKLVIEWVMSVEISYKATIGRGLQLHHAIGTVINGATVIGEYCTIRQTSTIGVSRAGGASPRIGNHVDIGSNTVILGDIDIGDDVSIGAGSVVVKPVPAGDIVAGNPAHSIKRETRQ